MVETWRDSWFEQGSRLIYILSTSAVDGILPLQVIPAPSRTVRVFVGRIELIPPETTRTVESALARGDWSEVAQYSRFLDPLMRRIFSEDPLKASEMRRLFGNYLVSPEAAACR